MALSRQGLTRFDIDEGQLDAFLRNQQTTVTSVNAGADELENNEDQTHTVLSEFTEADPTTFDGMSEKQRRNINSLTNIGGGGGALYTQKNNPFGRDEEEDKAVEAAGEIAEFAAGQREKEIEEKRKMEMDARFWENAENDKSPSADYPGLTVGDVLRGLRIFNQDPDKWTQRAIDQGLIKEEQRASFKEYMRQMEWLERQKYLKSQGLPNELDTPEGKARQKEIEQTQKENPNFIPAGQDTIKNTAKRDGVNASAEATAANGQISIDARTQELAGALPTSNQVQKNSPPKDATQPPSPTSVARTIDGNTIGSGNTPNVNADFKTATAGTTLKTPDELKPPIPVIDAQKLASNGASMNAGMI